MHGPKAWDAPRVIILERRLSTVSSINQEAAVPGRNKGVFEGLAQAWYSLWARQVGHTSLVYP